MNGDRFILSPNSREKREGAISRITPGSNHGLSGHFLRRTRDLRNTLRLPCDLRALLSSPAAIDSQHATCGVAAGRAG